MIKVERECIFRTLDLEKDNMIPFFVCFYIYKKT